jgi:DNA polymerase
VILALGSPAAKSFLGAGFSITRQRGIWYVGPGDVDLIVTFHPAYILRQTGGNMAGVKKLVWADLQAVRRKLDELEAEPIVENPVGQGSAAPLTAEPVELKLDL